MADGSGSSRALVEAARELETMRARAKKAVIEHKKEVEQLMETAVVGISAGALGYIEGRFPDRAQVAKIPISGVVAIGALGAALSGYAGDEKTTKAVLAVGQGAAAAFAYKMANTKGQAAAKPAA